MEVLALCLRSAALDERFTWRALRLLNTYTSIFRCEIPFFAGIQKKSLGFRRNAPRTKCSFSGETRNSEPSSQHQASSIQYPVSIQNIASNLHFSKQVMHLMHFSLSIQATSFFFQTMASAGQLRKQTPHLVHISGLTSNCSSATQRLAGHRFSYMWASYSCLK